MSARKKNENRFPLRYIVVLTAVAWIVASFMLDIPPASWMPSPAFQAPEGMEAATLQTPFPDKPPFRFGSRTLSWVCREYGIDADSISLELAGFAISARPDWSIKKIAENNDMETGALFEVIREVSLDRGQQLDVRN
ncbi:MAG TPA: hypothetical protein VLL07_04835 [Pontiella sp.]|nr:hypothetical protein [Pontiella sp.]